MFFEKSGGIEIKTDGEPSIEDIKNEIYHQLFQSGAYAEKSDDSITFKQGFFSSMARKSISGISFGSILISRNEKNILLTYQFNLKNYFIGTMLLVFWLAGVQWFSEGKLFPAFIYPCFWASLFAATHIISPLEFKKFLRQCVKANSTKR